MRCFPKGMKPNSENLKEKECPSSHFISCSLEMGLKEAKGDAIYCSVFKFVNSSNTVSILAGSDIFL